jgi:predicted PilT family ATPase
MSTPAEIIAARVNGNYQENDQFDYDDDVPVTIPDVVKARSIADESAFPALGDGKKIASIPSWGPSMKSPVSAIAPRASSGSTNGGFKLSTIQDAFSLEESDQLNVARPEFNKILNSVKQETNTSVESSVSQHTKKRTFLISGKPEDVRVAKSLIIRRLTKPVKVSFSIPAKVRSRVIGPQGKVLKPILQENAVKIDIGNVQDDDEDDDEDDVFGKSVIVTIDGDAEGVKRAKTQILDIVKEETKNLSVKIPVDDLIKPLVAKHLESIVAKYDELDFSIPTYKSGGSSIIVIGERDLVISAKAEISDSVEKLQSRVVVQEVPIPKLKHQFLPIDQILEQENVLIKLPSEDETNVKFIGEKKKIAQAQEKARITTSQYKVEVLDMSKAHKGNLKHVRAVALLLNQNGTFKQIATENDVVINAPSKKQLIGDVSSIPIEIVVKSNEADKTKKTKSSIVSVVNKITPDQTKVVSDIDPFFSGKINDTIKDVAKENGVEYVILGNDLTLFHIAKSEDSDDFEDFEASNAPLDKVNESLNKLRSLASELETFTFKVAAASQSNVSGPRNTTLKSILSTVEPQSVVVNLHTPSDDEVTIRGLKSEASKVKKEIESVITDAVEFNDSYKVTVDVPSSVLPRLIGKNGANVNELRQEFGVKIDSTDDRDSKDKSEKAGIEIVGIKRNVEAAKARINQLSKKWADETLARIKIENKYHRRMIGPKGVYINRLQDKYNVKIRFPNENQQINFADAPKSKDEVTIKGPSKGVAKAEEELLELYTFEKENGFTKVVQIPVKSIARVIGKAGETINDIADGTGIEFRFSRDQEKEKEQGYAEVELTGSKPALKEAEKKIQEIIDEVESFVSVSLKVDPKYHRDLIGQGGSVMKKIIDSAGGEDLPRNKYFRLLNIPNEGSGTDEITSQGDKSIVDKVIEAVKAIIAEKEASITEEIDLAKEKHKFIVGPGGSIRHSLQDEFGVVIEIPRPNDDSTIIKVTGLPEKIAAAKVKISDLTKDDFNESIDIPEAIHILVSERGAIFKRLQTEYGVEVQHGSLTRQASKLTSQLIPTPPELAYADDDSKTKFTIVDGELEINEDKVIPWRLKGDKAETAKVYELLKKRVEQAKQADKIGWFYCRDPSKFSRIIGPQGSRVNNIRSTTNTFITIPRANDKNSNFIYLVGNEENLKKADKEFNKLIN